MSAVIKPLAFAIRNDQGFWVGIWNALGTAGKILASGQPSHNESVVELCDANDPMLADAIEIADSCARADVECHCLAQELDGVRWYDVRVVEACELDAIAQAMRYLKARGLITHHPAEPGWVRLVDG